MSKIKPLVFLPPCLLLLPALVLNAWNPEGFHKQLDTVYKAVINHVGWVAPLTAVIMLVVCAILFFSPFGRTVIGGADAKPLLKKWNLFAIVVCVNIGIGILFWGPVEPVNYLHDPPVSLGITPGSPEAVTFATSTVFLHNTILPLSFAALVGLMFAFAYYNMRRPFTLGAPLAPLMMRYKGSRVGEIIDAICLFALVAAVAASLGGTLLLLGGGVNYYMGVAGAPSNQLLGILCAAAVAAYTGAAVTGLAKGIRVLANIKTVLFVLFLSFIFINGATGFIITNAFEGLKNFVGHFFQKALFTDGKPGDPWPHNWTQMYMSGWCAWAPLNGLFFGRIAYGYTVRTYLLFNIVFPAIFMGIWMAIISGALIHLDISGTVDFWKVHKNEGDGHLMYAFIEHLPFVKYITPAFLVVCFISFITSTAAVVSTMAGLCSKGVSLEKPESSAYVKIFWGSLVGLVAWIMITFAKIDGIRMLSNFGGLPALFLCLVIAVSAIRVMMNPAKFDTFDKDYVPEPSEKSDETKS